MNSNSQIYMQAKNWVQIILCLKEKKMWQYASLLRDCLPPAECFCRSGLLMVPHPQDFWCSSSERQEGWTALFTIRWWWDGTSVCRGSHGLPYSFLLVSRMNHLKYYSNKPATFTTLWGRNSDSKTWIFSCLFQKKGSCFYSLQEKYNRNQF